MLTSRAVRLPRVLTAFVLGGSCAAPPATPDAGCMPPTDFPPDASSVDRDALCECQPTQFFHCQVEGGPRCASWSCFPQKTADGGYQAEPDGGIVCLC
jgi:hypothetical protein